MNHFIKLFLKHKLIFKGEGILRDEIIKFTNDKSLNDFVKILPPEIKAEKIFEGIDILVLPSEIQEGNPLILIEALSQNISIIKSHFPNDDEAYNEEACFIFKPGSEIELFSAMEEAVSNADKRNKLLGNGNRVVREKFNLNNFIE